MFKVGDRVELKASRSKPKTSGVIISLKPYQDRGGTYRRNEYYRKVDLERVAVKWDAQAVKRRTIYSRYWKEGDYTAQARTEILKWELLDIVKPTALHLCRKMKDFLKPRRKGVKISLKPYLEA
jgi:hypothetical protein